MCLFFFILFYRCFCGALNSKTILFVSSNLNFIRAADNIVIMKDVSTHSIVLFSFKWFYNRSKLFNVKNCYPELHLNLNGL